MTGLPLLRRFSRDDHAIAAIEFAIIVPVVIALFATMLEFGLYYRSLDAVNKLASQYAIAWADCSDDTSCGSEATAFSSSTLATNLTQGLAPASYSVRMFKVSVSGTTITADVKIPSTATVDTNERTAILNKIASGQEGVIVTVSYTHSAQFFASTANTFFSPYFNIKARVVQLKNPAS
jgi:Flp pilus assembly protein TadG